MYDYVAEKYILISDLMKDLMKISVVSPITVVPVQDNGEPGLPFVTFDNATANFTFGIPAGSKGQDLTIELTFATLAEMYAYTDPVTLAIPETGTVAFVDEDSKVYIKLNTGVNTGASDWSTGTIITPTTKFQDLSDTPPSMVGMANYLLRINAGETGLEYYENIPGTGDANVQYDIADGTEDQHAVSLGQLEALGIVEPTPNTVAKRDGLGGINAQSFTPSETSENTLPNYIMTSVNLTDNMQMRPTSLAVLRASIGNQVTHGGWVNITLLNAFTGYAKYRLWSDGKVEIRCEARNTSGTSSHEKRTIGVLPTKATPLNTMFAGVFYTTRAGFYSHLEIEKDGDVRISTVGDFTTKFSYSYQVQ